MCGGTFCNEAVPFSSLSSSLIKSYLPEKHHDLFKLSKDRFHNGPWNSVMWIYGCENSLQNNMTMFCLGDSIGCDLHPVPELTDPIIAHQDGLISSNGVQFMQKRQILSYLQRIINQQKFPFHNHDCFIHSIVAFFLRTKGLLFEDYHEIVPLPKNPLIEIRQEFEDEISNVPAVYKLSKKLKIQEVFEELKKILPVNKKDPDYLSIFKLLQQIDKEKPVYKSLKFYTQILDYAKFIINKLNKFIDTYPEYFRPGKADLEKTPPVVRVFKCQNRTFVLAQELLREMSVAKLDISFVERTSYTLDDLTTLDYEAVCKVLGDEAEKIEFLIHEIRFERHRTPFIPSFNGKYCFQVTDLILEILQEMISVHGYFQNLEPIHWNILKNIFMEFEHRLTSASNGNRMVDVKVGLGLKKWILNEVEEKFKNHPRKVQTVQEVRPGGFSLFDFINEARRLGITRSFPKAEIVARQLFSNFSKPSELTTREMHHALEGLQLACFFSNFHNILMILHSHGACYHNHFITVCYFCNLVIHHPYHRIAENKKALEKAQKDISDVRRYFNQSEEKVNGRSMSETSDSRKSDEDEVESSLENDKENAPHERALSDAKKKKEKRKRQAEKKKLEKKEQVSVPEMAKMNEMTPENRCEKCFRTSQFCEDAKMKLKEEKVKTKALRKELEDVKKEKDAEIQELKEKLAALEASTEKATSTKSCQTSSEDSSEVITPLRVLNPSYKYSELSAEVRDRLDELRNIRASIPTLQKNVTIKAKQLIVKTEDSAYKSMARLEQKRVLEEFETYSKLVDKIIDLIRSKKCLDDLPPLPDLPSFSTHFEEVYEMTVNEELLDKQCLICTDIMIDLGETIKCKNCKRRHHRVCAWDMIEKGRDSCTVCPEKLDLDQ